MALRLVLAALVGWLDRWQQDAVAYLIEETRILRVHVRGRILSFANIPIAVRNHVAD